MEETRTDGERLALGFAYAREVERACAFVALDAEAQVDRALQQMDLPPHPISSNRTTKSRNNADIPRR